MARSTLRNRIRADKARAVHRRELAELPILGEIIAAVREELPRVGLR